MAFLSKPINLSGRDEMMEFVTRIKLCAGFFKSGSIEN
jgi:hypothetical protein